MAWCVLIFCPAQASCGQGTEDSAGQAFVCASNHFRARFFTLPLPAGPFLLTIVGGAGRLGCLGYSRRRAAHVRYLDDPVWTWLALEQYAHLFEEGGEDADGAGGLRGSYGDR